MNHLVSNLLIEAKESEYVAGFFIDLTNGKICKGCGIHKDYELYYFQNKESNIYDSYCKQCVNNRSKKIQSKWIY